MATEISNRDDIIDSRDVMARIEELEDREDRNEAEQAELGSLRSFMDELRGNGGDELWRGDWYPIMCIRDSHFPKHARDLADDLGVIDPDARWPSNCIDWEQAAEELQMDYTSVSFGGVDYWVR